MAGKNRFKHTAPAINFDDPSVLTAVPAAVVEEPITKGAEEKEDLALVEIPKNEEFTEEPVGDEKKEQREEKKPTKENLLEGIVEQRAVAKSYALYLETDVVAALDKLAKQNKVSRSKALNALLRSILMK